MSRQRTIDYRKLARGNIYDTLRHELGSFSQNGLRVENTATNRAIAHAGDKSGTDQSGPGSASAKDESKMTEWFRMHSEAEAITTIAAAVSPRQRDFMERCYAAARAKDAIADENPR